MSGNKLMVILMILLMGCSSIPMPKKDRPEIDNPTGEKQNKKKRNKKPTIERM